MIGIEGPTFRTCSRHHVTTYNALEKKRAFIAYDTLPAVSHASCESLMPATTCRAKNKSTNEYPPPNGKENKLSQ